MLLKVHGRITETSMPQGVPKTKTCQRCGQLKRLNQFYYNFTKRDLHNGMCKACQGEVNRENAKKRVAAGQPEKSLLARLLRR